MTKPTLKRAWGAFTLIEVAVIVFTLALLACFIIPGLAAVKRRGMQQTCRDNLKMVGLSYRTWSLDSSDRHPQHIEVENGGTKEWLIAGQLFLHFRAMSNELVTPKILVCPADKEKTVAPSFNQGFSNRNVSYFASLDAEETYPQVFQSGDRNLAFAGVARGPGSLILTTNPPGLLSWTKAIHDLCGNVGLSDGSVQMFDQQRLAAGVQNQGEATNRLVLP